MSKHNVTAGVGQSQGHPQGSGNGDGRQPATPEREANGQFAAGNKGGPGNPFGRTMAARRRAVAEAVDEVTLKAIMATLIRLAIEGDVGAAKLVLQYAVGKPAAVAEPDRVDVEEWGLHQESAIHQAEMDHVLNGSPIRVANVTTAALTPEKEKTFGDLLRGDIVISAEGDEVLTREEAADRAEAEREWDEEMERRLFAGYAEQERQQKEQAERSRPSANGANGRPRPSGNGTNGAGGPSANGRNGHHRRPHDGRNGRAAG